jgi:hypothetical protein
MSLRRDLRHGGRIGRAEFVRSVRGYTRDTRRVVGLALAVLFLGGNLLFALPAVHALGRTARSVSTIPYFEPAATLLPLGCFLLAALRTVERLGGVDAEELLLTTVHPRAVVVGLLTAELGRLLLWFGVPLVAVAGAFAVGLGAPSLPLTVGIVVLPVVCCTAVWGYAAGIGLLRVLRRLPTLRRVLKVVGVLALVATVVLSQVVARHLVAGDVSFESVLTRLSFAPLVDYLAVGFVGTPVSTTIAPTAGVVLAAWIGLTPVGLAVAERQATARWFTDDPVRAGTTNEPSGTAASGSGFSPPRPFSWSKSGRVAWGHLVRAVRHPQEFSHLLMLVFLLGPIGGTFFQHSSSEGFPLLVAGTGVLFGVYLSGATFGLNPLGDDRPQLPLVLLTETAPGTFLRARMLAGLAVGLPFVVLVPLASIGAGTRPLAGVAFAAVGTGFALLAASFALGLGCAYPIYEERELWGAETVAPSMLVLVGYSFVVIGGTVVGLGITWFGLTGNLAVASVLVVGLGVYLLLSVGLPVLSYWYSQRRYRRYVLD